MSNINIHTFKRQPLISVLSHHHNHNIEKENNLNTEIHKKMYFSTDAPFFEAENNNATRLALSFNVQDEDMKEELEMMPRRLHETYAQINNETDEPMSIKFEIELVRQSQIKISGEEQVPARTVIGFRLQTNENSIHDFNYFLADQIDIYKPVWLMGTHALLPSLFAGGIASGKLILQIDSPDFKESRCLEYTLQDECLLLDLVSHNTTNQNYRLKITNSFLFAEVMDADINDLVEVAMLPEDVYKIKINIRPSGRITCSVERL